MGGPRRVLRPLAFVLLAGCGDDEPAAPPPLCTVDNVTVQVGAGATPVISWTPRCSVHRISVFQPVDVPREAWRVRSTTGIAPGVRYGAEVRGATTTIGPVVLTPGVEAVAEVLVERNGSLEAIGGVMFTP